MIPLTLELSNFLSYREGALLDFAGIHLACISGLNGAGKSSILDGLTWALFGKSRSKSDDDVVNRVAARQGGMAVVQLTFEQEGQAYRVIRQKKYGGKSTLEFQLSLGHDQWKTLTEGRIRQTQAAIETLLNMNYDTFTNASFFLQGRADEFTTKTAGKRKEILADLLGVNRWDAYREAATERRKQEELRLTLLNGRIGDIGTELGDRTVREGALDNAEQERDSIAQQLATQEQLLQQARQLAEAQKQQTEQVAQLKRLLDRSQRSLSQLHGSQRRREAERAEYGVLLAEAATIAAEMTAFAAAKTVWEGWQKKAQTYHTLLTERRPYELTIERERSRLQEQAQAWQTQAERVAKLAGGREQQEADLAEQKGALAERDEQLAALAEQEEAWQMARLALQKLEGERRVLTEQLAQEQAQATRIAGLKRERVTVAQNEKQADVALGQATQQLAKLAEQRLRLAQAQVEKEGLFAEQVRLRESMEKLRERIDRLEGETGGACPLCGQALTDNHRRAVLADLTLQGKEAGDRFRGNNRTLTGLEDEVAGLEKGVRGSGRVERDQQAQQKRLASATARLAELDRVIEEWAVGDGPGRVTSLQTQLADNQPLQNQQTEMAALAQAVQDKARLEKEQKRLQQKVGRLELNLEETGRVITEWTTQGQAQLDHVTTRLAQNDITQPAQAALAQVDEKLTELGYDEAKHLTAQKEKEQSEPAVARHQALKQAEAAVKPLDDTLADLAQQVADQEGEVAELAEQHRSAAVQLATLTADSAGLRTIEDGVFGLREAKVEAERRVGAAQQHLAVLGNLRQQKKQLLAERAELTRLIQRLRVLEKACGRDGVQALLIEQALPEIEEDANELLERLSGGAMRVRFDTQRELKSGKGLRETLDIHIGDNAGERPYENFSGGEQFRVNFAIRLALSRILAKRAGARLRTLVIDEGFGSQDPAGRQRLIEAINTIQNDFAVILVITHIDELKDAFQTRIEVDKGLGGSMIRVV